MSAQMKKPAPARALSAFEMKVLQSQNERKLKRSRSKEKGERKIKQLKHSEKLKVAGKMSVDSNENLAAAGIFGKEKVVTSFPEDGLVEVVPVADFNREAEIRTSGCKKRKGQKSDSDCLFAKKGRKSPKNDYSVEQQKKCHKATKNDDSVEQLKKDRKSSKNEDSVRKLRKDRKSSKNGDSVRQLRKDRKFSKNEDSVGQLKKHMDAAAKSTKKSNGDRLRPPTRRSYSNQHTVLDQSAEATFQPPPNLSARKALYRLPRTGHSETVVSDENKHLDCSDLRCVSVEEGVVLVLGNAVSISMQGRALLSVLQGQVTLYGHNMTPDSQPVKVVSPTCSSLVTLTCNSERNAGKSTILTSCKKHRLTENDCEQIWSSYTPSCVVLYLKKLESPSCDFVTKVFPFQTLFSKSSSGRNKASLSDANEMLASVDVTVSVVSGDSATPVLGIPQDFVTISEKWAQLSEQTDDAPKLLTCGGKNSGKSTFNRFLINSILQSVSRVCYLDCDVGQTEFTPPGCVSLHIVEEPIIGPPFSHQTDPYFMCFFGPVTPSDNPRLYSGCVQRVYEQYERLEPKPPLLINTMGWNKGLGVNLMIDTCHVTRPNMVVQLESMNQANNFPAITPEFVASSPGWIYNSHSQGTERFNHELTIIDSPVVPRIESQFRYHARELRELSVLAYFSRCLSTGASIQSAPTYRVPWSSLAIHTSHMSVPPTKILAAINCSVVALCVADHKENKYMMRSAAELDSVLLRISCPHPQAHRPADCPDHPLQFDSSPVCQCLGFGIVRGVDPVERLLYIISPLDPGQLIRVNTLIRGSTNIPDQLLLKQKCGEAVPYVDTHVSVTGAASVRARRYMPRRGRELATPD